MSCEDAETHGYSALSPGVTLRGEMRGLLVLGAPIIGTMLSRMAMGFVDFVMVSRLGTSATAAISPSTILVFTFMSLGLGLTLSIQTFAAQALGRGQPREGAAYAWQALYIAVLFVLVCPWVSVRTEGFWALIGSEPEVQALQTAYCRIAFWAVGFAVITFGLEGFFNGIHKTSVPMVSAVVALVFNGAANWILIFGKLGFPAMGIRGAAYATVIAWGIRSLMLAIIFLTHEFRRTYATTEAWRPSLQKLRGIVYVGGPSAIQWVLDIGAWFVFLAVLMKGFGTAAMAASNIVLQYMHISFMPAIGIATALGSTVGRAIGQRRPELALLQTRACMIVTGLYMGSIGLLFLVARAPLMRLMSIQPATGLSDPAVVAAGAGVLIWAAIFQVFDAAAITHMSALRGAGDTRWPAVFIALNCWIVFIGGGYLASRLAPSLGIHGPWLMCTLYIILYGLVLRWRWRNGAWRRIDLFKDKSAVDAVAQA